MDLPDDSIRAIRVANKSLRGLLVFGILHVISTWDLLELGGEPTLGKTTLEGAILEETISEKITS